MADTYRPRPGSLVDRVLAFFEKNPDEELSRSDVAVKFELGITSVSGTLAAAVQAGLLRWEKDDAGRWVYRAGQEVKHG